MRRTAGILAPARPQLHRGRNDPSWKARGTGGPIFHFLCVWLSAKPSLPPLRQKSSRAVTEGFHQTLCFSKSVTHTSRCTGGFRQTFLFL